MEWHGMDLGKKPARLVESMDAHFGLLSSEIRTFK
jgi:hypothetical protein